ncbi:scavenger receptor class B member 1-like isoform X2 [Anoplophora glabripennis]|nr:scavenger receptor class B member 1-like isoform X2 [Anoplophora glabripennis]
MVISNSSNNIKMWTNPSPKSLVKVHIFNYTNLKEYDNKWDKKLKVQEVGPYVYEESLERVNVQFDDDGNFVSFQEKRSYNFRPDLSKGKQSDQVHVPNIPLMAGTAMSKYHNYFVRLAFSSFLTGLDEKPFVTLPADKFIIGYRNKLLDLSQSWTRLNGLESLSSETVGILASKNGVQPNVITMNTGKADINKLGLIEKLNGKDHFEYWSTEECDRVTAADGMVYPPKLVQRKQPLHFLIPQMCRTLPLVFENEATILNGKIPAYRYKSPEYIFDTAEERPGNQCYCSLTSGDCPLKGVYNVTPCNFGVPSFISNPHFLGADESLLTAIDGLKTLDKKDIETYINLHPSMGFSMSGRATFQLNVQVQKAFGVYQLDRYDDGLLLPIAWLEIELNEKNLPQDFLNIIYEATYTLKGVKMAFEYGFLLTTLITLICIILVLRNTWERPNRLAVNMRDLQRQAEDNQI